MTPPDYPVGKYEPEPAPTAARRAELIGQVEALPSKARAAVAGLGAAQLDTPYKKWTVRQIVHHLADSHMNAFIRFRLALTEDVPTVKPYDETGWAGLADTRTADVELSLKLLEALHTRWAILLRSMTDADWDRSFFHPEHQKTFTLGETLALYAHHGRHHTGQIEWLRKEKGWGG
jgi:uncharacterized damage-inducible protein DinB